MQKEKNSPGADNPKTNACPAFRLWRALLTWSCTDGRCY